MGNLDLDREKKSDVVYIFIVFAKLDPRRELYGSSQSTDKHTQSS